MDEKLFCYLCKVNTVKLQEIKDENGINIRTMILKHLMFIEMNDYLFDEKICQECWTELKDFNEFYNKIEQAQSCIFPFDQPKFSDDIKGEFIDIKIEPMEIFVEENHPVVNNESKEKVDCRKGKKKNKEKPERGGKKKQSEEDINHLNSDSDADDSKRDDEGSESDATSEEEYVEPKPKPKKKKTKSGKPNILDEYAKLDIVIREHMQITCNICDHPFETLHEMKSHCKDVHNKLGFVLCCGRQYKRRTHLHTHIMEHKFPEKYLVCDICKKKFKTKKSVDLHKKVVHTTDEERPYVCEKCPKRFALMSLLNGHRVFHDDKKLECPVCGKRATNSSLLNAHIRTHDVNRSHMCEVCSKSFLNPPSLKAHMLIHSTEKVHCGICGLQVRDIKEHSKSHMDLQLPCPECDKILPTKAALKAHKRYHHRMERIFACTYCEKSFKRAISLKEHMATHTGEILYVCPHCPATFNSKANYYKHKKICAEKGLNQSLQ